MSRSLSVIYYAADPLSGRRSHWSLFLSDPIPIFGETITSAETGTIYEAQGGLLQMTFGHVENVTPSNDPTYRGKVDLCVLNEEKVKEFENIAARVKLPSSPLKIPKGTIRRDCQDWVADVLAELVKKGVVEKGVEEKVEGIPRMIMLE